MVEIFILCEAPIGHHLRSPPALRNPVVEPGSFELVEAV